MEIFSELLPIEICQLICDECEFQSCLMLISSCKGFYDNLFVTKIMPTKLIRQRLTHDILSQTKFSKVRILDLTDNLLVTDLSFTKNLEILYAQTQICKVTQKSIDGLNLRELYVSDNRNITNVSHMSALENLNAAGLSGISQEGLGDLNLVKLWVFDNARITDCSHMSKLKLLDACGRSGIGQNSVDSLDLEKFCCSGNTNINRIPPKILLRRKIKKFITEINKVFFVEKDDMDHNYYCRRCTDFGYTTNESPFIVNETNDLLSNMMIETMNSILDCMETSLGKRKIDYGELEHQPQFKKMRLV